MQANLIRKYNAIQGDFKCATDFDVSSVNRTVRAEIIRAIATKYYMSVPSVRKVLKIDLGTVEVKQTKITNQMTIFD
jgi:hypothetical protein